MKGFRGIAVFLMVSWFGLASAGSIANKELSVGRISDSEIFVKKSGSGYRCSIDQKPIDIKPSSDEQSVIVSGTSYILVDDLMRCNPAELVHAKIAAPHVGFLSDVNLRAGVYASLVPVAVNPMSFVAVVAKIGSDKNLVNLPGFYRAGVRASRLLSEASSNMSPVISLDGRYVSLDLYSCESDDYVDVFDIRSSKRARLDRASCEKLFNFQ